MSKYQIDYYKEVIKIIKKIQKNQKNKISKTAQLIKKSYKDGGILYLFGTGHSHMLTIEAFFRAGGYAGACPIIDKRIDFSSGALKATSLERTTKLAKKILSKYKFNSKDILMIFSNSGVNQVPIEAAFLIAIKAFAMVCGAESLTSIIDIAFLRVRPFLTSSTPTKTKSSSLISLLHFFASIHTIIISGLPFTVQCI